MMASADQGMSPPPKPWERAGSSSGPSPFKPPSTTSITEALETAKPSKIVPDTERSFSLKRNILQRSLPPRPWEQNHRRDDQRFNAINNYKWNHGVFLGNNLHKITSIGMGNSNGKMDLNRPSGPFPQPPGRLMFFIDNLEIQNKLLLHLLPLSCLVDFFDRISSIVDNGNRSLLSLLRALRELCHVAVLLHAEFASSWLCCFVKGYWRKLLAGPKEPSRLLGILRKKRMES